MSMSLDIRAQNHVTWEQFLAFFSCAANRPEINEVYDRLFIYPFTLLFF